MEVNNLQSRNTADGIPPKDEPKIITDPAVTGETDDIKTDEDVASPELGSEPEEVETTNDDEYGLNTDSEDIGLNHDEKDDLSLNWSVDVYHYLQ